MKLMQAASGESPRMWGSSIVGFGSYHYVYESGREGDAPLVGFSPRKSGMVLYLHLGAKDQDTDFARLGKHATGKGCLTIKTLADVDQKILKQIVAASAARMRKQYPPKA